VFASASASAMIFYVLTGNETLEVLYYDNLLALEAVHHVVMH
jgi:hypothetical protein